VAYANRCGQEDNFTYCGLSCIVGPDGKDGVPAGTDYGRFLADIVASNKINPYLANRRPELYTLPIKDNRRILLSSSEA
jgi:predicted amidohydrolase